jgi:hypothetical protein
LANGINTFFFSGSSDAKGRNGYFKLDHAHVWIVPPALRTIVEQRPDVDKFHVDNPINIDIFSKRPSGNCGPIRFVLSLADLQILRAALEVAEREYHETATEC